MDRLKRKDILEQAEKAFGKPRRLPIGKLAEMRYSYMSSRLSEAYRRNDNINWLDVFEKIKSRYIGELSTQDWTTYCLKQGVTCEVINGKNLVGGYFDLNSRIIVIQITPDILYKVIKANPEDLKGLSNDFWVNFCHEDTHRQQFAKANKHYRNRYKAPSNQYWSVKLDKNFDYFDQAIESDAYGREIGARLKLLYSNKSISEIFDLINKNDIEDLYCKHIINVYKDPRISFKNNHSFFRALYDYLSDNEDLSDFFEGEYKEDCSDLIF